MPLFTVMLLQVQKHELFRHVEHRFSKKQIVQLNIPLDQLCWIKKNKELIIEGQMFDVKQITIKAGIATVTGFFDKEEDKLNKHLSNSLKHQKQSEEGKTTWQMIHLFAGGPVNFQACFNLIPGMEKYFCFESANIYSLPKSVTIPPPLDI
ncbi:MAG: hypothetical protein V4717_08485 [Bacteroidota bacterium]